MTHPNRRQQGPTKPEGEPLVPPTTEVIADLTLNDPLPEPKTDSTPADAPPAEDEPKDEPETPVEPEPVVEAEPDPEPEPAPPAAADSVTFICDQWAGVRLHGTSIKFEDHRFTTSDPSQIARLDAWEHARRETS